MTIPVTAEQVDQALITYLRDRLAEHANAARVAAEQRASLEEDLRKARAEVERLTQNRDSAASEQTSQARFAVVLQQHLNKLTGRSDETTSAASGVPAPFNLFTPP
ncbi:hypothetical protein HII36_54840, partial [Nonomuraea sp. NN258]|uniref:hypothetical protein n=1 Tax=Nonomuraea antri TaxID=2730852 RepID=UPI001568701E